MQCPYLTGKQVMICMVNGGVYVPCIAELEQYCRSEKYQECPLLCNYASAEKNPPDPANGMRST